MVFKRRIMVMALVLISLMTLTGCQESVAKTETIKQEGSLTIYTSMPDADIQVLSEAFNKTYPDVEVSVFRSGTEEVVSKIMAEKEVGNISADVLLIADAGTFETLKNEDLLMSYKSKELQGISKEYYDEANTYTGTKIISTGIIINTDLVKQEVKGYQDLLAPSFKDQLIMPSPLYSGAAAYNLGVLTRTDGIGWAYYEGLKDNGVTVDKGNGAVQKAVVGGEKSAGIIVDYMAIRSKADGAPVEFVYPEDGSLIITEPIGILKASKNPEIAKLFVDYALSEAGQEVVSQIGYTPIKEGVSAPEGFKTVGELTNLTYDLSVLAANRDADKEKFTALFQ